MANSIYQHVATQIRKLHLLAWGCFVILYTSILAQAGPTRSAVMGGQPLFQSSRHQQGQADLTTWGIPGSLWYQDEMNAFYNPALVFDLKNTAQVTSGSRNFLQGGAWVSRGAFVFGVYTNRVENLGAGQPGSSFSAFERVGGRSADFSAGTPFEIFGGFDYGVKFGAKLTGAQRSDEIPGGFWRESSLWHLDLGAEFLGFEPFVGFDISSGYHEYSPAPVTHELDRFQTGVRFQYETLTPYLVYSRQSESFLTSQISTSVGSTFHVLGLGVGRDWALFEGFHGYTNLGFWWGHGEDTTAGPLSAGWGDSQWHRLILPLDVAAEYEITSGIKIMAGLSYDPVNVLLLKTGSSTSPKDGRTRYQRGIPRPRLGATADIRDFTFEVGGGIGPNAKAVNTQNREVHDLDWGLGRQAFVSLGMKYHFPF